MISANSRSSVRRKEYPANATMQCTKCRNTLSAKSLGDAAHTCPKCGGNDWVVYKPESKRV